MGIQINGSNDTIQADDGSLSLAGSVSYEDVTNVTSVGLSTFSSGIHIDDSITHLGDTDTKIRFPAADTVTVETGGNERVRITSAGNFGIGDASPARPLSVSSNQISARFTSSSADSQIEVIDSSGTVVYGSASGNAIVQAGGAERLRIGSNGILQLDNGNQITAADTTTYLGLGGGNSTSNGANVFLYGGSHASNASAFVLRTNTTERLRIDSSGNIGIGGAATSNVSTKTLQVTDSTTSRVLLEATNSGGRKYGWYTSTDGQFAVYDYTASSERMRIDSSGNVGIDFIPKSLHANVTSSLNVGSSSLFQRTKNSYVSSNFYYNSSDIGKSIASGYAPVYQQDVTNGAHIWFKTNNASAADETISLSEAMRITSSGDVGIGNNDPGTLLHVSSSNNGAVRIGGNNAGSTGLTITYDNSSFTTTTILQNYRATNGNALLDIDTGTFTVSTGTSGTERLRINAGGNMGLGSNSPNFSSFGSNTGGIEISDVNTNNALLVQSGSNEFFFANSSTTNYIWGSDAANLIIGTNSTERFRIDSSGRILVNTTSASGSNKLQVASSDALIYGLTVGRGAGAVLSNTALGTNALDANTTGANNTAIGYDALTNNTTGGINVAIGNYALDANTSGSDNTAVGLHALGSNTTAAYNTAVGRRCMFANTTGANNTAIGANALEANTTGIRIVAVGYNALSSDVTPEESTAVGYQALANQTSGRNHAFGYNAGLDLTTGSYNTLMGGECGENLTTGNYNTAFGLQALRGTTTGSQNVVVGSRALDTNTTGNNNIAIGHDALTANTNGTANTAVGTNCMLSNTGGDGSTAVGYKAMESNTTSGNVALGYHALRLNASHQYCVAVGYAALEKSTAVNNTALGHNAGVNITTGNSNTAIGAFAMDACQTPSDGTAVGHNCLTNLTTGQANTAVGRRSAEALTTGNYNTFLGTLAGLSQTTGDQNVSIGFQSGNNLTTGNYNTYLGSYSQASSSSVEKEIVLGYNISGKGTRTFYVSADSGVYHAGNTTTWSTTSDRRIKKNIVDNNEGLSLINQIAVKNFEYKTAEEIESAGEVPVTDTVDKTGTQIGVIAQELQEVRSSWVKTRDNGTLAVTGSDEIIWHLVNAVKELSAKNAALEARIASLEA